MTEVQSAVTSPFTKIFGIKHYLWYAHTSKSIYLRFSSLFVDGILTSTYGSCPIQKSNTFVIGQSIKPQQFQFHNHTLQKNKINFIHVGRMDPSKEIEKIYGVKWKEAVNRTFIDENSALVVTLNAKPISAFYSSSTGGATQDVKDVWGSAIAYLQGVPDPWSLDTSINPRFAYWETSPKRMLLEDMINDMQDRVNSGGYIDIEHLFVILDANSFHLHKEHNPCGKIMHD